MNRRAGNGQPDQEKGTTINKNKNRIVKTKWVRCRYTVDQCCGSGSGAFSTPGSGMNFSGSQISDPEGMLFGEIFLNYLQNPCSFTFSLIYSTGTMTCSWNHKEQEKGLIYFSSLFLCPGWTLLGSGVKNLDIRIRNKTSRTRNTDVDDKIT
jgi:hypothetical protein